jgi:hypothetical protein
MSLRAVGELRVPTGCILVGDPGTTDFAAPASPLARRAPTGVFPVEVALATFDAGDTRVACARVRFADRPATKWEAALFEGDVAGPDTEAAYGVDCGTGCFYDAAACGEVDEATSAAWLAALERNAVDTWCWHVAEVGHANVVMFSSGWGDGFYGSYWGFDERGEVVELVTDFNVLVELMSERLELPLPLTRGTLKHPWLAEREISVRRPLFGRTSAIVGGRLDLQVALSDDAPLVMRQRRDGCLCKWKRNTPGLRLVITVTNGVRPLDPV